MFGSCLCCKDRSIYYTTMNKWCLVDCDYFNTTAVISPMYLQQGSRERIGQHLVSFAVPATILLDYLLQNVTVLLLLLSRGLPWKQQSIWLSISPKQNITCTSIIHPQKSIEYPSAKSITCLPPTLSDSTNTSRYIKPPQGQR